ncbi:uncharacterized protein C2845_PM05G28130 [Panicum miliaceum]|uniref:DUF6598 domain-containing protein n=1 Tax=Panicum miliaceum TaxID=4540 RepID=A0A3L6SX15_PANMI|nr:uncharacterized protein C2845_PM05G28130 [Panicum miliaceum]
MKGSICIQWKLRGASIHVASFNHPGYWVWFGSVRVNHNNCKLGVHRQVLDARSTKAFQLANKSPLHQTVPFHWKYRHERSIRLMAHLDRGKNVMWYTGIDVPVSSCRVCPSRQPSTDFARPRFCSYGYNLAYFDFNRESSTGPGPPFLELAPSKHKLLEGSVNVVSLTVHESDVGYPVRVFGTVLARDQVDYKCVYHVQA